MIRRKFLQLIGLTTIIQLPISAKADNNIFYNIRPEKYSSFTRLMIYKATIQLTQYSNITDTTFFQTIFKIEGTLGVHLLGCKFIECRFDKSVNEVSKITEGCSFEFCIFGEDSK